MEIQTFPARIKDKITFYIPRLDSVAYSQNTHHRHEIVTSTSISCFVESFCVVVSAEKDWYIKIVEIEIKEG